MKAKPAAKVKAKPAAKKPAPKAAVKPKPATKAQAPKPPTEGEAWGNASLKKQADAATPIARMTEPSGTPPLALHDHEGEPVTPVESDDDGGSPRLDDREDNEA